MKVIQVVPGICDESQGPSCSVPACAGGLVHNGVDVELFAIDRMPDKTFDFPVRIFPKHKFPIAAMGRSPELLKALMEVCKHADIVHTNSLWMFPNVYPYWATRGTACKLVIGPRGTVSLWAIRRSRLKKFVFGHLWQYPAMRAANMFVASCQEEADDIRRLGYRQPIAIVPNGVDVPEDISSEKVRRRRMFFLSRIHPKKNLELLIHCWSKLEGRFPDWDLSIVGPDINNRYADAMKTLARRLGCGRVKFEGELNGVAKQSFIAASECMVLPTHSENFAMAVAESLAISVPVICSRGAPWAGLVDEKCGWWIPATERAFLSAMTKAMSMSRSELSDMGARGREWMKRDFTWDSIGRKLKEAYEWLLNGMREDQRPLFVC